MAAYVKSRSGGPEDDPLTGLPTYDVFLDRLAGALARVTPDEGGVALALFDVDAFARINEAHGRGLGDRALVCVAGHLREALGARGDVFRYGGDAFAVLFEGMDREQAFLLTEQAREAFDGEHTLKHEGGEARARLTLSAGLAACPDDGNDESAILTKANEALYRAKVAGPNKVCLAREEKMVTKTSHYTQGQLQGLARLARRMGMGEAVLLREALHDLLRKYNA